MWEFLTLIYQCYIRNICEKGVISLTSLSFIQWPKCSTFFLPGIGKICVTHKKSGSEVRLGGVSVQNVIRERKGEGGGG